MASKREVQLKKVFPELNEKVVKDYKCALYLDFHHPGRMFITQNTLYFFSRKNIEPPLPNPLAVSSAFKDLDRIEKSGIDGITVVKGEEEILFDSFQFRDQTFELLSRHFQLSKGKSPAAPTANAKPSYEPLDLEVTRLLKTGVEGLPFLNDLGLLAQFYQVTSGSSVEFSGKDSANLSQWERLLTLLTTLCKLLDPSYDVEKLKSAFEKHFASAEDPSIKYSLARPTVIQFLQDNFDASHPVITALKAAIHPVTAAILRLKDSLTSFFPTKDRSWAVHLDIESTGVTITHVRHEEAFDESFQIQWKMSLAFSPLLKELKTASLHVTDLIFHPEAKESKRYEIQQLVKEYFPPPPWGGANSIVLPSFVDLSNQNLTTLPPQLFNLKGLQTLYVHANKLETLPEELKDLKELQVLYLNQNKLSTFPSVLFSLPQLQELHLGRNGLKQLPSQISEMSSLRELSLSYNELTVIPQEITQLKNLRKLYVHNNHLESVPVEVAQLPHIKTLQLHNNQKLKAPLSSFGPHDSEEIIAHLKSLNI